MTSNVKYVQPQKQIKFIFWWKKCIGERSVCDKLRINVEYYSWDFMQDAIDVIPEILKLRGTNKTEKFSYPFY